MRKILAYMLFLIFICMVIPIIFTNRKIETTNGNIVEDEGKVVNFFNDLFSAKFCFTVS